MSKKQSKSLEEAAKVLEDLSEAELEALMWKGVEDGTILAKRMPDGEWGFSLSPLGQAMTEAGELTEFKE